MKNFFVMGASSGIALEVLKTLAKPDTRFYLVARNVDKLNETVNKMREWGAEVMVAPAWDANESSPIKPYVDEAVNKMGHIDCAFMSQGYACMNRERRNTLPEIKKTINVNSWSVIEATMALLPHFEGQGFGRLAVVTSVAGDRGRSRVLAYSTAKASVSQFLHGLQQRYAFSPISILDIKPGYVETPMTEHMKKNMLFTSSEKVAPLIKKALFSRRELVYVPGYWFYVSLVLRALPRFLFYRLKV